MSNKMNLYQIIASVVSLKDLINTLYDESEQLLDDDFEVCIGNLDDVLDTLLKYMPCITD